jgi:ABC-type Fe3+ transport system substrate-binding protein
MKITRAGRGLMFLSGLALLGYAAHRYWTERTPGTAAPAAAGASGASPGSAAVRVRVALLYGTEKERWLKAAVEAFARQRPDIGVDLRGMGTIDAVRAIAEGREKPTVWSPADEIATNLLDTEWSLQHRSALIERAGDLAPQPLVLTPLVMIAWEERARLIAAGGKTDPTDWRTIHALTVNPKGWMGIGGPEDWGFVKPGHTAPSASNSGLQTIVLMAYAYHQKRAGLRPADILNDGFQKWLREIESGVGKFGTSSGTYMKEMILYGPSKYDFVWNYESVAIGDMAAAQGRWGNLAVYYPKPTLWSNHPYVVPKADWVTAEQRAAAVVLRDFLLSPEIQTTALTFGFRSANPDVKVLSDDPANPWNRLKPFGVRVDVPAVAEPPSGEVTRLLLETWRRVVEVQSR